MYRQKLVLADDEPVTLQAIQTVIEAECPDVEIAQIFRNGRDVIEYIRSNPVDILVTDIRMPLLNGIEVLKYIHTHNKNIRVMIMTGYKDFEYAQMAIQYGADALLTKPLNYEDLINHIHAFCRSNEQNTLKTLGDTEAMLRSRDRQRQDLFMYFEQVLSYPILCERYPELAEYKGQCFVLDLTSDRAVPVAAWQDICEISDAHINSYCILKNECTATLLLLTRCSTATQTQMHVTLYVNDIKSIIEKAYGVAVCVRTAPYENLSELHTNGVPNDVHLAAQEGLQYVMGTVEKAQMLTAFYSGDFAQQKRAVSQILHMLEELFSLPAAPFFQQIEPIESTRELLLLLDRVKQFVQLQKGYDMLRIKHYIYLHCDQELNLETAARAFGMNYSYFSRMFKEKSGETASSYITRIRIAKAKQLLLNGLPLEDVARTVGYDAAYLVKKFKKETGMTPNQYLEAEHAQQNS